MRTPFSVSPEGVVGVALLLASALTGTPTSAAGADYGPNTCLNGFVWRAAFAGDMVCVTPETKRQVAVDNREGASRRDPGGAYGPRSCKEPFVWPNARASEVTTGWPSTRRATPRPSRPLGGVAPCSLDI